ncbi:MAG: hypothetical protein FWD31_01055, partial [Planctomycetaceae bacterium]|nr:hypothetical protein [Planctomycetaceae bacterium]
GCGMSWMFIYFQPFRGTNFSMILIPYLVQWAFILFPLPFAICQVSPESSNRMMPVRVCMTLFYVLTASLFTVFLFRDAMMPGFTSSDFNTAVGMTCSVALGFIFVLYPIIFLINICEREKYSIRQRRLVPRNSLLRFLYFLHATGVANAALWYFLFLLTSLFLFGVWYGFVSAYGSGYHEYKFVVTETFWRLIPFAMIIFLWAFAAFWLWKRFLHRFLPREWLSFPLFCFGIICFIFYIVAMTAFRPVLGYSNETVSLLFAIFPIVVFEESGVQLQYFFGVVGMFFLMFVTIGMSADAWQKLSPYDAPKILSDAELREAVERTQFVECESVEQTQSIERESVERTQSVERETDDSSTTP